MMKEGLADLALIDDPLYLYDFDEYGYDMEEIGYMGMVYVDNGPSFIRYKYGAQRVAFMFLDSMSRKYSIDAETYSLSEMLGSNKSFFVDEEAPQTQECGRSEGPEACDNGRIPHGGP